MDEYSTPSSGSALPRGIIIAVIIVFIGGVAAYRRFSPSSGASSSSAAATPTLSSAGGSGGTTVGSTSYRDGSYSTQGTYQSPGGQESIGVQLTLVNDTVTVATVTENATDRVAKEYQDLFMQGYRQYVVGRKIDTLSVSHISGSSLTSQGFNTAVESIRSQAKS